MQKSEKNQQEKNQQEKNQQENFSLKEISIFLSSFKNKVKIYNLTININFPFKKNRNNFPFKLIKIFPY